MKRCNAIWAKICMCKTFIWKVGLVERYFVNGSNILLDFPTAYCRHLKKPWEARLPPINLVWIRLRSGLIRSLETFRVHMSKTHKEPLKQGSTPAPWLQVSIRRGSYVVLHTYSCAWLHVRLGQKVLCSFWLVDFIGCGTSNLHSLDTMEWWHGKACSLCVYTCVYTCVY